MKDNVTTFPGDSPHWTASELLEMAARDDVKLNPSVAIVITLSSEGVLWRSSAATAAEKAHVVAMLKSAVDSAMDEYIAKLEEG